MSGDEVASALEAAMDASLDAPKDEISVESFRKLLAVDRSELPPPRFLPMRDSLPLAVRTYPARADKWLILIHGAGGHSAHLHGLAQAVAAANAASVCVPDMRGNGRSGARRSDAVTYADQLRDDALDVLAALQDEAPGARFVICGHSAGGGLALRLCADALPDVARVALLAPLLSAGPPVTRAGLGGWVSVYGRRVKALMDLNRLGVTGLNGLTVMEFNQPPDTRDGRETLAWSFETMRAFGPSNWRRDLTASDGRCAILVGDADECFVGSAYGEAVGAVATNTPVDLLSGCGHWDLAADARVADWLTTQLEAV